MLRLVAAFFFVSSLLKLSGQEVPPVDGNALVQKIQGELPAAAVPEETKQHPQVSYGETIPLMINDSAIYPGTENSLQVFVPAAYDPAKPACLLVKLDGFSKENGNVIDNLIASREMPVTIAIGIGPGAVFNGPDGTPNRHPVRFNRSYEFDSVNDHFPDFILNEVLPAVEKLKTQDGRPIHLSRDGNDHAATGGSTGGIGSFTLAWRRPDQFTRVYDVIGTFVSMRGGHEYPALIRKTDPKPIRIFLEDGSKDAWNLLFGSWFDANLNMESALSFAGYDVAHAWGDHGHDGKAGAAIFPDVMRWLWRDYPVRLKAGVSKNSTLQETLIPGEDWQKSSHVFQGAAGLAANAKGEVFASETPTGAIDQLGLDDTVTALVEHGAKVGSMAFGPDGTLYGVAADDKKIVAIDPQGKARTVLEGVAARGIVATHDGTLYLSEPGEHSDMPSQIWQVKAGGEKKLVDQGLASATGVALSTDGALFFAAEKTTKWIYSFVVQADGSLAYKEPFYWLHMTDIPNDSGAEDLAIDTHGNLYVATRMGVQVCDQNGRVRAILPLPTPCGPARGICFGGEHFDTLYVTDGTQIFRRKLKLPGFAPWAAPVAAPSQGKS